MVDRLKKFLKFLGMLAPIAAALAAAFSAWAALNSLEVASNVMESDRASLTVVELPRESFDKNALGDIEFANYLVRNVGKRPATILALQMRRGDISRIAILGTPESLGMKSSSATEGDSVSVPGKVHVEPGGAEWLMVRSDWLARAHVQWGMCGVAEDRTEYSLIGGAEDLYFEIPDRVREQAETLCRTWSMWADVNDSESPSVPPPTGGG
ncbi:hypothetical protein nbrc107696_20660 [Gordonia spumicola]|uniref:Uncharacterized protein n=2 Tax=Gordonia spumicola TaxID=589161 RepID=A0A7I9V957_9ACTN|nr:hypothetical protein nbrc107696_20660 [Gordonia spumicola]